MLLVYDHLRTVFYTGERVKNSPSYCFFAMKSLKQAFFQTVNFTRDQICSEITLENLKMMELRKVFNFAIYRSHFTEVKSFFCPQATSQVVFIT